MGIKRKLGKGNEEEILAVINRGGKPTETSNPETEETELRFTLRIPKEMVEKIDAKRKERLGNISRNTWILESILKSLHE